LPPDTEWKWTLEYSDSGDGNTCITGNKVRCGANLISEEQILSLEGER
jgi:hypothetical protein